MSLARAERRKYEQCWAHDDYRKYSPGESVLPIFKSVTRRRGTLVDIGCGTGRAGQKLADAGYDVTLLDFAKNAPEVELPYVQANIWGKWPAGENASDAPKKNGTPPTRWDYGYCCDVMEHMPPEKVDKALKNIFAHCDRVFFSIHFSEDQFGAVVGHPLHLTVKPFSWWRDKLAEYREVRDARDLIGMGTYFCV